MKKTLLAFLLGFSNIFSASGAIAENIKLESIPCYFFRGAKLEIQQTCSYQLVSWAGGGFIRLTWKDGIETKLQFGLQGRGERICPQQGDRPFDSMAVDNVCGKNYLRSPQTLKRISQDEANQLGKTIQCTQIKQNSVCWMR